MEDSIVHVLQKLDADHADDDEHRTAGLALCHDFRSRPIRP